MANRERIQLFTAALRSGRFQQGTGALARRIDGTWQYCCLGVACEVAAENGLDLPHEDTASAGGGVLRHYTHSGRVTKDPFDDFVNYVVLPASVSDWYGFDNHDPDLNFDDIGEVLGEVRREPVSAAEANDGHGKNFAEIADAFDATYVGSAEPDDQQGVGEP
jgi:hypothetical protein